MSSRHHQSGSRPMPSRQSVAATPGPSRNAITNELPPYRKPSHPLTAQAQQKLRALQSSSHSLGAQSKKAAELVTEAAGLINDHLRERKAYMERRRKKWDKGIHLEEQEEQEAALAELQEKVDAMTKKLEESIRGVIDTEAAAARVDECLAWVRENAARTQGQEYDAHMSQRQSLTQAQSQRRNGEDGDEDEEDERPTPGPTPLTQARAALTGPSEMFASRLQRRKDEYVTISHAARYSKDNHYIGFKQMVHDATYGEDPAAPPVPRAETWFTERGSPAPGVTAAQGGEDDDDDIVVDKATVSTRCPITFQTFKEPYTSKKCPHTFEKSAILEMIRRSRGKMIECPVAGCQQNLVKDDLHENLILIRKIKRMQLAEERAAEESDEEDEDPTPRKRPKQEHFTRDDSRRPPSTMMSEVVDLGSPSDEDDE